MHKVILVGLFLAIPAMAMAQPSTTKPPSVSTAPDSIKSGEAGYKIGCSTAVQRDPCTVVCGELWSEAQKKEMAARCALKQKNPPKSGGVRVQ